ncbi:hypothetical protein [Acetobacter sp.]
MNDAQTNNEELATPTDDQIDSAVKAIVAIILPAPFSKPDKGSDHGR